MAGGLHPPPEVIASWPNPNYVDPQTRGYGQVILCAVLGFFSIFTVSIRLWTRARVTNNFGIDDFIILLAMFPTLGMAAAIGLSSKKYYFDRHVWDVPIPVGIVETRKISFAIELLYIWAVGLIKISILFFYKRLSADILPKVVIYILWFTIALVICFIVTFTLTLFTGCQPLNAWWQQVNPFWTATHAYTCMPDSWALLSACIVSVIQDFVVAALPTIMFLRMDIPFRQKVALAGVFAVGFFLCVTGILRIVYIYRIFFITYDVTWQAHNAWQWTAVEGLLGTIVASAPALKIFFQRHLETIGTGSWDYIASQSADRPPAWPGTMTGLPARVSRRLSGNAWAWGRAPSDSELNEGVVRESSGPPYFLERVSERPSQEKDGRQTPILQARRITAEDVRQEEERERHKQRLQHGVKALETDDVRVDSRQRALGSHPTDPAVSPVSPISTAGTLSKPNRSTWYSNHTSEFTSSVTASGSGVSAASDGGFDPDAHALPILTEQETHDLGIGVAK